MNGFKNDYSSGLTIPHGCLNAGSESRSLKGDFDQVIIPDIGSLSL